MNQSNSFYKELFLPNENLCKDKEENNSQHIDAKVCILTQLPYSKWSEKQTVMMDKIISLFHTKLESCIVTDFSKQEQLNTALQNKYVDYVLVFGEIENTSFLNLKLQVSKWNLINSKKLFLNPSVDVLENDSEAKSILWKGIQQEFKK